MELCRTLSGIQYSSDKPAMDNFEPSQLALTSSQGFAAERFIKPPVTVYIRFPCSVTLEKILIENSRGAHVSTGLEVYSYACANNRQPDTQPVYTIIGKCYNANPGTVTFTNRRLLASIADSSHVLSSHDRRLLNLCRTVAIRITQTLNSSLPVIARISIFGRPHDLSYYSNRETICTPTSVSSLDQGHVARTLNPQTSVGQNESHIGYITTSTKCDADHSKGPDLMNMTSAECTRDKFTKQANNYDSGDKVISNEFIDPITMEIMSQPVLLPSGKTVDQSTLDRHNEHLAMWGLKPCDPFTGQSFDKETSWQKPQLNIALKERIDKFTLTNHISNGRSLRRKPSSENDKVELLSKKSKLEPIASRDSVQPVAQTSINDRIDKLVNASANSRVLTLDLTSRNTREQQMCCDCRQVVINNGQRYYKLECNHLICTPCLNSRRVLTSNQTTCRLCGCSSQKPKISAVYS